MADVSKIEVRDLVYLHSFDEKAYDALNMRHCHDTYEILYVVKGGGRYLIEGAEFSMRPRTLVIMRPFEYHCVEVDKDTAYERYVIRFSASILTKEAALILEQIIGCKEGESGNFFSPENISQAANSVFDRFEYAAGLPEKERAIYVKLLISELIVLLSVSSGQRIVHNEGELGAKVIKYINEYLDRNISLDDLARRFFISKYYLCRAFKEYTGVSVHAYINHKRVIYAKQLIEAGETASGAAYKVGFGDYSAFYRAYVKILGMPPTMECRKKQPAIYSDDPLEEYK